MLRYPSARPETALGRGGGIQKVEMGQGRGEVSATPWLFRTGHGATPWARRRDAAAATPPPRRRRRDAAVRIAPARRRSHVVATWSSRVDGARYCPIRRAVSLSVLPAPIRVFPVASRRGKQKNGKPTRPTSVLSKSKCLGSFSQKRKIKKIRAVGFEPTPPKRLVPETSALDHSARPAWLRFYDTDRTRTCDPDGN